MSLSPSQSNRIPLARPEVDEDDVRAVVDVLRSERLSMGSQIEKFESELCRITGARFGVAVSSGTAALHLLMIAAGLQPDDEVITTPLSFIASANCVMYVGARPVFVDVAEDMNIDPERICAAISPRTRAILAVHLFGQPCPMDAILSIAEAHGLAVLEDSCEALGASYRGKGIGSFGRGAAFGFYPNKQITTGEGGAIVTSDENWAELFRSLRNQGRSKSPRVQYDRLGYNYRLTEMQAALGASQLRRLSRIVRRRAEVAGWYAYALGDFPDIILPPSSVDHGGNSWFVFVIRLAPQFTEQQRDAIVRKMGELGIECGTYFPCIHLQSFLRTKFGWREGDFPRAEQYAARTIALPFSTLLTREQVERVAGALKQCVYAQAEHAAR